MRLQKHYYLVLIAIWLFATLWNLDKPFHMDDAGHLEIARWIESNPFHPMSGLLNWNDAYEPIYKLNQPHLYFYLMAVWGHFWGYSEVSMHVLMSLFTLWAIFGFYRLATLVDREHALVYTGFFAMSPGFILGQNSMVDIPMLAIWIEFFYALLNPAHNNSQRNLLASVLCALALLVKYTSLILLPAIVLAAFLRRRRIDALWTLVPIATLVAWSLFNLYDYGGVHLLERAAGSKSMGVYGNMLIAWIVVLGAISPFAIFVFLGNAAQSAHSLSKYVWLPFALVAVMVPVVVPISIEFPSLAALTNSTLLVAFAATGVGLLCLASYRCAQPLKQPEERETRVLLAYWAASGLGFIVLLAPFIAARHVVAAVPALILLTAPQVSQWKHFAKLAIFTLVVTASTSSLLAKADFWYASIYRDAPPFIAQKLIDKKENKWFLGHWGWQWYAQRVGWKQLALGSEKPLVGDYLIAPLEAVGGDLPASLELSLVANYILTPTTWFEHYASVGLYFNQGALPWGYSTDPVEQFVVYRITAVRD